MSTRIRRRYAPEPPAADVFDPESPPPAPRRIETIVERLCACTCGNKWWAQAGTTTRCEGNVTRFRCPVGSKPFEVPE